MRLTVSYTMPTPRPPLVFKLQAFKLQGLALLVDGMVCRTVCACSDDGNPNVHGGSKDEEPFVYIGTVEYNK